MATSILIVEDDQGTAEGLELYLRAEGYSVTIANDGPTGLEEALSGRHSLVLLDLMLPGMYGTDVCRAIRAESSLPIIMLTARALEEDQIRGLDLGADDYVVKPFSPRQVMARTRSLLRRHGRPADRHLRAGDLEIEAADLRVRSGSWEVTLTPTEMRILATLARAGGRALSRAEIVSQAFGGDFDGFDRAVDGHVKNIRRKLEPAKTTIETVFGVGYRLRYST